MARLDAIERLNRRGIVAWRFEGALARLTEAQSKGSRESVIALKDIVATGAKMATAIRDRVTQKGDLGKQAFPGYSTKNWSRLYGGKLAASYVLLAGGKLTTVHFQARPTVAARTLELPIFDSSSQFHRSIGMTPGSYHVTGGMWKGLQARGTGRSSVILDFAGSSPGSGGQKDITIWDPNSHRKRAIQIYESANVRNGWKSGAIYDKHNIHVLKPTKEEVDLFGVRVSAQVDKWMGLRLTRR